MREYFWYMFIVYVKNIYIYQHVPTGWFSQQHAGQGASHYMLKLCNSPWNFGVSDLCGATDRPKDLSFPLKVGTGLFVGCFFTAMCTWFCVFIIQTGFQGKNWLVDSGDRLTSTFSTTTKNWLASQCEIMGLLQIDEWREMAWRYLKFAKTEPFQFLCCSTRVSTRSINKLWSTKDWIKVLRIGLPTLHCWSLIYVTIVTILCELIDQEPPLRSSYTINHTDL